MGKIVKYCSSCDENFAEKFGFCPNCGASLQAFEMNPVAAAAPKAEVEAAVPPTPEIIAAPVAAEVIEPVVEEPVVETPIEAAPVAEEPVIEAAAPVEPEAAAEIEEPVAAAKTVAMSAPVFTQTTPVDVDRIPKSLEAEHDKAISEGGFYVTVIEEKNAKQRNLLLLGALAVTVAFWMSMAVISLFGKDLDVGSINDDIFNAVIVDDLPATVEEEQQQKKDKDAGGGGGGGRQQDETTLGDLANQTKNPLRPPEALDRHDFELQPPPASTQGDKTFEQKYDRFGDPNGRFSSWNNGSGTGGGQGNGTGTGQGSGRGTGAGSGDGSGYGSGIGNGNGNGTGDGDGGGGPPPPPKGVTQGIKILSKPRPGYTDSARQSNIQGTVIFRVTFLASGQVGSISAVKGLGSGLTEQAIAAARRIAFEPAKTNGVPQSVTKQIEYTFSIY